MNTFTVTVGVYDNNRYYLENTHGPHSITIVLVPTGSLYGTTTVNSATGIATFSNIRILSAGTFNIVGSCTNMISATSILATVTNYAYTMTASSSNSSPTKNFSFTVTVILSGEDTNTFTGSCTVSLTGTNLAGTLSDTTSTGTATFSVYITTTGSKTITATCPASGSSPAVTATTTVNVLNQILSFGTITPTVNNI